MTLEASIKLRDGMTKVLQRMTRGVREATSGAESLQRGLNGAKVAAEGMKKSGNDAAAAAARTKAAAQGLPNAPTEAARAQERFNQKMRAGVGDAGNLLSMVKKVAVAVGGIAGVKKVIGLSDELTQTTARLNIMNDGLQTTADLQKMIFASAQRSRGEYQATADAISKMGILAGDAFKSNKEIVAFMEQVNKNFAIAGTSAEGMSAAMLQLTQAMGSGLLRGEELNSIFEQAPTIIQSIASYLDKPIGKIRELAKEGEITAEIVKNALLWTADETNAKFAQMPMTFAQIWTSIKNYALMAFQPILVRLNEIANSEAFQVFAQNVIGALVVVAGVVTSIFDMVAQVAQFVSAHWNAIGPVIFTVVGAMVALKAATLAYNVVQGISNALAAISAARKAMMAGATLAQAAATTTAMGAQVGLNAAMLASPVTWIILAIVALIAILYAAVGVYNELTGSMVSATGIIVGVFATAFAFVGNLFIGLWNLVAEVVVSIYNLFAELGNFLGNFLSDPLGASARLMVSFADTVLGLLQGIASAIDALFGTGYSGMLQGARNSMSGWAESTFGKGHEIFNKLDASSFKKDRIEYGAAFDTGYAIGDGLQKKVGSLLDFGSGSTPFESAFGDFNAQFDPFGYEALSSDIGDLSGQQAADAAKAQKALGTGNKSSGSTAKNTEKMADSMELMTDELAYLKDIAEQEAINRFTTAKVDLRFTNTNNVDAGTDPKALVAHVQDALTEIIWEFVDTNAEGVHI